MSGDYCIIDWLSLIEESQRLLLKLFTPSFRVMGTFHLIFHYLTFFIPLWKLLSDDEICPPFNRHWFCRFESFFFFHFVD